MKTKLKKLEPVFKWHSIIQMIGLLGIIFMIVNVFIHIVASYWWIGAIALYLIGMIAGTKISREVVLPPENMN